MPGLDVTSAQWWGAPGRSHYESYFLEAVAHGAGRGLWLRCTANRAPGGPTTGGVWAAVVDPTGSGPVAVRTQDLTLGGGEGAWIRCEDSTFAGRGTAGRVDADGHHISWSLEFTSHEPPLLHLPRPWMYRARLPRTKLTSPLPAVLVDGHLDVDGSRLDVHGWRGVVGHNWGEQHAERWVWLHGVTRDGPYPGSWIDVAVARVRVAGLLLPWTAFGAVSLNGRRFAVGGLGRRTRVTATATACELELGSPGVTVTAAVTTARDGVVAWDYLEPSGTRHPVSNCPVADVRVLVQGPGGRPVELAMDGCGVYEYGDTAPDPGLR